MKRIFAVLLSCAFALSLSVGSFAEEPNAVFAFTIPETVSSVTEIKAADAANYYANTAYFTAMGEANNTVLKEQTVSYNGQSVPAAVYIHAFQITDLTIAEGKTLEEAAQAYVEQYRKDLPGALDGTYLSLITLAYDVQYALTEVEIPLPPQPPVTDPVTETITTDQTTDETTDLVTNVVSSDSDQQINTTDVPTQPETPQTETKTVLMLYVGFAVRQETAACSSMIVQTIVPKTREWSGKSFAQQMIALNEYLLSGEFSVGERCFSSVEFAEKKTGDAHDFAAFAYLFLSQMGYTAEVLRGNVGSGEQKQETAWTLVKYRSDYYHCDFFGNRIADAAGKITGRTTDLLAVSTQTIGASREILPGRFAEHVALATKNYDLTEADVELVDRPTLKALIDTTARARNNEDGYTPLSFRNFADAYDTAEMILKNETASAEDITNAYNALQNTFDRLIPVSDVNKSELATLLSERYDRSLYVADTYFVYQSAVTAATMVYQNPSASQGSVDDAAQKLMDARNRLVKRLDKSALLYYADNLNTYLNSLSLQLSEGTVEKIKSLRSEFRAEYENSTITEELLKNAAVRYEALVNEIEGEQQQRDAEQVIGENTDVGRKITGATDVRTLFVLISAVFVIAAIVAAVLYFKRPKKK